MIRSIFDILAQGLANKCDREIMASYGVNVEITDEETFLDEFSERTIEDEIHFNDQAGTHSRGTA